MFQKGLIDQSPYALKDGSGNTLWNVYTDGLRNLTGQTNSDGTFTLFATTSTVSNEQTHDLGADPNELVSITIGADSTPQNTLFTVLQTAAAGDRLGGVALAPVPEPESIALLLGGLGVMSWFARRRAA